MPYARPCGLLLTVWFAACAPAASPSGRPLPSGAEGTLETQRGWWRALATGDTAFLAERSADSLVVVLSSGRAHDRAGTLAQSRVFAAGQPPAIEWNDEAVRNVGGTMAIATARSTERVGISTITYRYLTVMERSGAAWRVSAAQSTREAVFTPRISPAAGAMGDYVGEYRGPRGGVVRVVARDSVLALIEPSGLDLRMEPIGPALFEFDYLSPGGMIIRIAFARDAAGRVVSLSRLTPGAVNTFLRVN